MKISLFVSLAIGCALGVAGTMAFHVDRVGPEPGDWLAFAGALVGVALTIVGTLWLEDYRARRGEREGIKIVRNSVQEIQTAMEKAARLRGDQPISEFRLAQIELEEVLIRAIEKYIYARHYVPKQNIEGWQASEELANRVIREKAEIESEVRLIKEHGDNENVLRVNLSKVAQSADRLRPYLEAMLRIVKE